MFLGMAFLLASPALAASCSPLQRVASLEMTPLAGGARETVPLGVNGSILHVLLDTEGGSSSLTAAAGKMLGLRARGAAGRLLDANGNASRSYFLIDSVNLGGLRSRNYALMVTPTADGRFDGVLAADLLSHFDVEMDFAAHRLALYSQDHCPGQVVYWTTPSVAVAQISVRSRADDKVGFAQAGGLNAVIHPNSNDNLGMSYVNGGKDTQSMASVTGSDIRMTVTLDGKDFTANIDTGLEVSTLNTDAARAAFGVTADSPNSTPLGGAARAVSSPAGSAIKPQASVSETVTVEAQRGAFEHTFHTLSFGGVTVANPRFTVRPDLTGTNDPDNGFETGSHTRRVDDAPRPDISIGMDVLRRLHLFFAFGEGKLYITPGGPG
jgi:predicted aspartyl protease